MGTSTAESILGHVPLFEDLSESELALLTQRAALRSFPKNAVLVTEGDATDSLYIIQSGKVKIFLSDEEGKEIILTIQNPGEYFGEISLLDSAPRSASAMALEDCKLYVVSKKDFEAFLVQHPEISLKIIRGLTARLRTLTDNVKSLALMDVYGRIANTLLKLAEDDDGKMVIKQRLTHKDIASMVGSSREMVSRIMKDLTRGGYLATDNNRITINERLPSRW